jgi:hypothetical protein
MDRGGTLSELAAPLSGYLFEGRVARIHTPGDGLRYSWGEEHRDSEELDRIVAQLVGKPVAAPPDAAYGHPIDLIRVGAPHKITGKIVGARRDGDHAVAWIFITDPDTIKAIREDGIDELSLGYGCRADASGKQFGTIVDHLAVVPRARCGATCALGRADGVVDAPTEEGMRTDQAGTCTCQKHEDGKLNAKERHALPTGDFADPKTHQEPLEDEGHVRAAMSRFEQTHFPTPEEKRAAYDRILAAAKRFGIDASGFEKAHRMDAHGADPGCACNSHAMRHGVSSDGAPGAAVPGDLKQMDELQKKLADALAEAAAQKVRADQAEQKAVAEKTRADAADQAKADTQKQLEKLEAERDNARADASAQKTRADAAEQAKKDAEAQVRQDAASHLDAAVTEKVALLVKATEVLGANDAEGKPVDRTKMSARDIKVAVIKHVDGVDVATEKSDDYVQARYDGALERFAAVGASHAALRVVTQQNRDLASTRNDGDTEDASIRAMHAQYRKPAAKKA